MTEKKPRFSPKARVASITVRIIYVSILTALLVVGGFVILENRELHKVIPPTILSYVVLLLTQWLSVVSANYFLANKSENFTDSITETCISLTPGFVLLSILGPHLFPSRTGFTNPKWWEIWKSPQPIAEPNNAFFYLLIPSALLLLIVLVRIFISRDCSK